MTEPTIQDIYRLYRLLDSDIDTLREHVEDLLARVKAIETKLARR